MRLAHTHIEVEHGCEVQRSGRGLLFLIFGLLVSGCSRVDGVWECTEDADCDKGRTCIQVARAGDAGACVSPDVGLCTAPCATDEDCAVVHRGSTCIEDCNGLRSCFRSPGL